jgi:glutathione S-transferase
MSHLELVSHVLCPYVQRAVIALTEKNVAFRRIDIDLGAKPAWFNAISPLGKVPLLRVRDGTGETVLFESAVICEYLEDTQPNPLHPADPLERARHRAWIEFASATLNDVAGFYNAPPEQFEARRQQLALRFAWLERHLGEGPYFAGERFSLVDAALAPLLRYFNSFEQIADFGFFADAPKVRAYRAALASRPSVQDAVVADYPAGLMAFLLRRPSHLASLIPARAA